MVRELVLLTNSDGQGILGSASVWADVLHALLKFLPGVHFYDSLIALQIMVSSPKFLL